jgi:hypothetical protein
VAQKRWGIRSLLFLGLAAASIILSNWMRMTGNTDVILLTFIGTVVGLVGAAVCTVRGFRAWGGRLPTEDPTVRRAGGSASAPTPSDAKLGCELPARSGTLPSDQEQHQGRTRTMRIVEGRRTRDVDVG